MQDASFSSLRWFMDATSSGSAVTENLFPTLPYQPLIRTNSSRLQESDYS